LARHGIQLRLIDIGQVDSLREALPRYAVGVRAAALPWTVRIAALDLNVCGQGEATIRHHSLAPIPGQRSVQRSRHAARVPEQRVDDRFAAFACHFHQHQITRLSLCQYGDPIVGIAEQQVAFPVCRHSPIFGTGRSFIDQNGVGDPNAALCLLEVLS
jgi:hypothetical protein